MLNKVIETPVNVNEGDRRAEIETHTQMQNGFGYELLNKWQAKTMAIQT